MNKGVVRKAHKVLPQPSEQVVNTEIVVCQNKAFSCSLPVESGFLFCIKHILQDPKAPYKGCTYIFGNGKHCGHPKLAGESSDKK
jgi:KAT8 regulatory NSL complex subunit 2